jgi:hypothetical protein
MNCMSGMTSPSYNQDFLFSTIGLTLEFLSDIIEDTQNFREFKKGGEFIWNFKLTKLTNNVSQFVELTTLLSKTIMLHKRASIDDIKQSHISLLFIMKAINQAQLKQDYVGIEELIKYELKDNLTQWKIDFIPQAKKLLNT